MSTKFHLKIFSHTGQIPNGVGQIAFNPENIAVAPEINQVQMVFVTALWSVANVILGCLLNKTCCST